MRGKVLFGVDGSETSLAALAEVGGLMQAKRDLGATIFHGTPGLPVKKGGPGEQGPVMAGGHEATPSHVREILDRARVTLAGAGFEEARVETIWQERCLDPALSMLELAYDNGFDTVVLARRESTRPDLPPMGSVAYRLVYTVDRRAVWVVDPPIASKNVLVPIVGAPISRRVVSYTARYFGHLKGSRFTFFHVVPPLPPAYWDDGHILEGPEKLERMEKIAKDYGGRVKEIADEGIHRLIRAGVPKENIGLKVKPLKEGMARDILKEIQRGRYGIVVIGRRGSRNISRFPLGSKAVKILHGAKGTIVCIVN